MSTASSSSTAYASSADLIARYDKRAIRQLASDTETEVLDADLPTNTRVLACLNDASGMVEAAVTQAACYSLADLAALTGVGLAFLKRLVCDLTMGLLFLARPDREGAPPKAYDAALQTLQDLQDGKRVFGLVEAKEAGRMDVNVETAQDVESRNGVVVMADRFFSTRGNRRVP